MRPSTCRAPTAPRGYLVRLREHVKAPSVLQQAGNHAAYYKGLLARSMPVSVPSRPPKVGMPLLVLPDVRTARLFDTDQYHQSGGCATVVSAGWENEQLGDLVLQLAPSGSVQHLYSLVAHSYGYTVKGTTVQYPGREAPTRLAVRAERIGRGDNIALALGSKDGGKAQTAENVKVYELPDGLTLRICSRLSILDEHVQLGPSYRQLMGTALLGSRLLESHISDGAGVWGLGSSAPEVTLQRLWELSTSSSVIDVPRMECLIECAVENAQQLVDAPYLKASMGVPDSLIRDALVTYKKLTTELKCVLQDLAAASHPDVCASIESAIQKAVTMNPLQIKSVADARAAETGSAVADARAAAASRKRGRPKKTAQPSKAAAAKSKAAKAAASNLHGRHAVQTPPLQHQ